MQIRGERERDVRDETREKKKPGAGVDYRVATLRRKDKHRPNGFQAGLRLLVEFVFIFVKDVIFIQ